MNKIMLIAGCSHTAGYEIDGSDDSGYNRRNSYGGILAEKLGYQPVNIAMGGSANPGIARSVLEWFSVNYDALTMDVFVLIGWTESSRMEIPWQRPTWYQDVNQHISWFSPSSTDFLRVNHGWTGGNDEERAKIPGYQAFMANNIEYLEIMSANCVLQMQYFLKMHRVKYMMCNTMHLLTQNKYINFYVDQIDQTNYLKLMDNDESFYKKYRDLGYKNPRAKYWHHSEEPHRLFAEELAYAIHL